jgi:hypothetical protein
MRCPMLNVMVRPNVRIKMAHNTASHNWLLNGAMYMCHVVSEDCPGRRTNTAILSRKETACSTDCSCTQSWWLYWDLAFRAQPICCGHFVWTVQISPEDCTGTLRSELNQYAVGISFGLFRSVLKTVLGPCIPSSTNMPWAFQTEGIPSYGVLRSVLKTTGILHSELNRYAVGISNWGHSFVWSVEISVAPSYSRDLFDWDIRQNGKLGHYNIQAGRSRVLFQIGCHWFP